MAFVTSGFPITIDSSQLNTTTTEGITVTFPTPLFLGEDRYELALIKVMLWYSWYNISAQFNNQLLAYSPNGGVTWKQITIIPGQYSIDQLSDRIQALIDANGDTGSNVSLVPDYATLSIQIVLLNNYQLDLTQSNLYQ